MKTNLIKSALLIVANLSLTAGFAYSQTNIEEYHTSGPLQLMFQHLHDQKKLTPCEALNRKAILAMGKQDWKQVFAFLMEAMNEDPTSSETFINYGVAHFMREEYPSSEKALLRALELDPENAKANYHYSQVMVLKGDRELAINAATQAAREGEEVDWKHIAWLGDLKIDKEAYQEAVDTYDRALVVLNGKLESVDKAIKLEESKQEIVEQYTDIEIVREQGGEVREVEVQKFRYAYKDAPEEWHELKAKLEGQLSNLQSRRDDALKQAKS
ncbi:MAG: hypothetical protein O7C75_00490 [Verrucomicrobia bacterium]|nr:hypothetical protein [Verrucomicrobiota bacterium]